MKGNLLVLILVSIAYGQNPVELWMAGDVNKDGVLERSETQGKIRDNFAEIDLNSDEKLDVPELTEVANYIAEQKMIAQIKIPENIEVRKNVSYRDGESACIGDLYLPKGRAEGEKSPGIIFVHGGAWKSGSKGEGIWPVLPALYAAKGYVCFSVDYRLLPKDGGFPKCVYDVKNAVRWLRAHAEDIGLDKERIGAYGNSAGAHLVSMLGLALPEAGLEGDGTYLEESSAVQAVCTAATPSNFLNWDQEGSPLEGFPFDPQAKPSDPAETMKKASPVTYARKDAPPFLIVHAEDDGVVPYKQATDLKAALLESGATDTTLMTFPEGNHSVFLQNSEKTFSAMEAFFKKHL